jgi:iron complex outermembrane recepter protein
LLGAERDRWANQDYRRYGGTDYRSLANSPGNVRSESGERLFGGDRTSTLSALSIVPQARQLSLALFSEYDLTPDVTAFSEVLYANRETTSQDELYSVQNAPVPQANPFNSYGQPVVVDFLLTGIAPRRFVHDMEMLRGVGGLRGSFGSTWQWEVAATASTETDDAVATNQINAARVNAALAATDPASALNPFVDGPVGSPELLASLIEQNVHHHFSRGRQFSAFTRGELFDLPAGPLQAVIGGEWRDESVIYDDLIEAVDASRDVTAAFTELRVPLIASAATRRDVLAMTLAARLDDYSDFGSTVNPQFGLMWRPTADMLFRGSYGTSFRPPSLFELHSPQIIAANVQVVDRARGNAISNVPLVIGGNTDLRPIEAESMTAGFVLTPSAVPELRLLASYWRVATEHRVTLMHFSSLLAHEEQFSDRVVRNLPTPQDLIAGIPGQLLRLDVSRMNFGRLVTSGIDVEANYEIETGWGSFLPRLSATWVNEFTAVDVPTTTPIDRVGIANSAGSIPRWRVVGTLGWRRDGLGLSTTLDWTSAYLDANSSGPTGRRLPPRALVDVQASVAVDEMLGPGALWQDLKLQVGVKNLFDDMPPFADIGFGIGFDSSQGDLVGRLGYIRVSKGF